MNRVSSSDGSICQWKCSSNCRNLKHVDYKTILTEKARAHTVNYNCPSCFAKFLIINAELVYYLCDSFRNEELLSDNFVLVCKHNYNDLIGRFIICKAEHENNPPEFFCSWCCHKSNSTLIDFVEEYGIKSYSYVTVACTTAHTTIVNYWSSCNGCNSI